MRFTVSTFLLISALGGRIHDASMVSQNWKRADAATVRLKPSAFVDLSTQIREELERRGCMVPQSSAKHAPHNVVRGHFTTAAQVDVGVLCSKGQISSILVFLGGAPTSVAEVATRRDADFLQVIGPGGIVGYSRFIAVANAKYIHNHYDRYGGTKPPLLDHDGINDGADGKASIVWY
jgi:hypothetical protein